MVELGQKAKDMVTGFEGIATGRAEYLTGCAQLLLVPKVKEDGSGGEGRWFDEQRLQVTDPTAISFDNAKTPGPDAAPSRRW